MRLILLGPPGAGKGTQAVRLAARFGVPHVATGDLLRFAVAWETEIGLRAKEFMDAGELVPDAIVLELLRTRLSVDDALAGFVLDGFPRNPAQAEMLGVILTEIGHSLDAVVSLEVPDEIIVGRLSSRASCSTCGATYTLVNGLPEVCANDGTTLFQRDDDTPVVIQKRLDVFHAQTAPLIAFYAQNGCLLRIDGVGEVGDVEERIAKKLANR